MLPNSKITDEVRSYTLLTEGNLFEELLASVRFEAVGKGRQGAVLLKIDTAGNMPIVRTTTRYRSPAQHFRSVHEQLAQQIQNSASLSASFNNALIENYTNAYTTMGSHSDQALDLADESFIAVFSCYKHPEIANPPRKLLVGLKEAGGANIEIPLTHNSVVVFSVDANRRLKHKIVLDTPIQTPENQWLGITFRTSKTFVRFRDESAYFLDGASLTLANDEQRREFYHLRHRENNETQFTYPRITYTISESDMMQPEPLGFVKS
ncbi:MAG: alpha-ketoglutarate-dependent dioxygenase AlkB [Planctomycetes bacterium]|nr:alpha-ketoglutarate-dependent dioxygenase AlkB [Planctomycetota bacterium]